VQRCRSTCKSRRRFDASLDSHWRTQDMRWRLEPRSRRLADLLLAHAATAGRAGAEHSGVVARLGYGVLLRLIGIEPVAAKQWPPLPSILEQNNGFLLRTASPFCRFSTWSCA
jgi:hypothetical protein